VVAEYRWPAWRRFKLVGRTSGGGLQLPPLLQCSKIKTQNFKKRTPLFFFHVYLPQNVAAALILPRRQPPKNGHIVDASVFGNGDKIQLCLD
jgi:hypothetical protein